MSENKEYKFELKTGHQDDSASTKMWWLKCMISNDRAKLKDMSKALTDVVDECDRQCQQASFCIEESMKLVDELERENEAYKIRMSKPKSLSNDFYDIGDRFVKLCHKVEELEKRNAKLIGIGDLLIKTSGHFDMNNKAERDKYHVWIANIKLWTSTKEERNYNA
jgi:hypothetical protein